MESVPPEILEQICGRMSRTELRSFIQTSAFNYQVCYNVYRMKNLVLKRRILEAEERARAVGRWIDLTNLTEKGTGIQVVLPNSPRNIGKMRIPGLNAFVSPERADEIVEILNTE